MVVDTGLVMLVQWPRYGFTGFFYGLLSSNSASRYNGDRDDSDSDLRFEDDHDGIVKIVMMLSVASRKGEGLDHLGLELILRDQRNYFNSWNLLRQESKVILKLYSYISTSFELSFPSYFPPIPLKESDHHSLSESKGSTARCWPLEGRNRDLRNQLSITLMVLMAMVMMVVIMMVMVMVMMVVTFHRGVMHNLHLLARPVRWG